MPAEQSYYLSLEVEGNNVWRTDRSLIINCTGMCVLPQFFHSYTQLGREDYYLQYLVKGDMTVWIDGRQERMRPGQAVIYYPHTAYRYAMYGKEEVQYYWAHFTGTEAARLLENCRIHNHCLMNIGSSPSIVTDFEAIFHDFILRDHCFEVSCAARLTAICVEISRRLEARQNEQSGSILSALSHIHQNYNEPVSTQFLADLEHLSPSRFRSLFKESTGLSPGSYLLILRLNHARRLMLQPELTICQISQAVGYQDQLYFSRIFKKRTGLSPSEYRSQLKVLNCHRPDDNR